MTLIFKLRDWWRPRDPILRETGIRPDSMVLDFGCGPGSYTLLAAREMVTEGRVYALDIQPMAVRHVQAEAARQGLSNVEMIQSDCATGLPDASIDVILLYDIFHMLSFSNKILTELKRVLKPDGVLSVNDHHMREDDILAGLTRNGCFKLLRKGTNTYSFVKQ
ncbi:MAG: class I SAM-dependent methyltransferase [Anaerolineae bacterium]|nr:class I SAM-dependent methyltransferase [Anaerolineae bacterium]